MSSKPDVPGDSYPTIIEKKKATGIRFTLDTSAGVSLVYLEKYYGPWRLKIFSKSGLRFWIAPAYGLINLQPGLLKKGPSSDRKIKRRIDHQDSHDCRRSRSRHALHINGRTGE